MIQQYFVTGWGGLVDWLPMLKPKSADTAIVTTPAVDPAVASTATGVSTTSALDPKPEKRRKRRK
jgi:hypothetical protein